MKNTAKQAVILENLSSPYVQQAIIILKEYNPIFEDKIIEDAEKIVSAYLNQPRLCEKSRRSFLPIMILSCIVSGVLTGVFTYIIR